MIRKFDNFSNKEKKITIYSEVSVTKDKWISKFRVLRPMASVGKLGF